jgi:hypothetical protein
MAGVYRGPGSVAAAMRAAHGPAEVIDPAAHSRIDDLDERVSRLERDREDEREDEDEREGGDESA